MCLSRIGQIAYGGFALASVGLILGSIFTPAWRQVASNLQQGQLGQLPPLNMGLFAFACQRSNDNTQNVYNGNLQSGTINQGYNTANQGFNTANQQGYGTTNNNFGNQQPIQQVNSGSTAITVSTQSGTRYLDLCIEMWNIKLFIQVDVEKVAEHVVYCQNMEVVKCGDSTYALNQCQSTCGKCIEVIRQNKDLEYCVDKQNNCASLKEQQKCVDPDIQKDCALTCNDWPINSICRKFTQEMRSTLGISATGGQVPGGNVAGDIGTNCAENKELCSDQFYKEFMEQYCKSTCINSVTSKSSKECKDKKHTNCVVWKVNGFCDSDFYGDDIRDEYCKETCHRC
uniref:ShKT domain-containing protein n=2 Tax=Meloidogyne javanica TaxID=6303 RepID=A0A915LTQ3_MELJA